MENNRNFFITIALSVLILTLWQVFYMNPRIEAQREAAKIEQQRVEEQKKAAEAANPGAGTPAPAPGTIPNAPGGEAVTAASRDQALAASPRVKIDTPSLERLDQPDRRAARRPQAQALPRETVDQNARDRTLLQPAGTADRLFRRASAASATTQTGTVPDAGHGVERRRAIRR